MPLASETVNNPAIDNLVQSSYVNEYYLLNIKWISYEEITDIEPTQIDNVYYAIRKQARYSDTVDETTIILLSLGSSEDVHQHLWVSLL